MEVRSVPSPSGMHAKALLALAIFVFVLTAVPRLSVRIGPVPFYFIDILIVIVVIYALYAPPFGSGRRPFRGIVLTLLGFAMLGEAASYAYSGQILEPIYLAARTTLAFLVFFAVSQLVRGPRDVEVVQKAAVLGLVFTASLMILTALPMTRVFVSDLVFSTTILEPASERVAETYGTVDDGGERGRTLVGVSILAALLYCWPVRISRWRTLAFLACMLAPMAVLMSYSRGPIIGAILLVVLALFSGIRRVRRAILLPVIVSLGIVFIVGVGSEIFLFGRLTERTEAVLEDPYADARERERILAYVEPFQHVLENPIFVFIGEGNAIARTGVRPEQLDKATHALFAKAYYSNGLIAAALYMLLVASAVYYAFWHVRHRHSDLAGYYSQALLGSVVALLPWAAFGHAIVSAPHGAMMFFFVLGLLTTLRHFPMQSTSIAGKEMGYAHRRRAAV